MNKNGTDTDTDASILVVDDNIMSRKVLQHRLKPSGFPVVLASSGAEALQIVESEPISLVLLDMLMDEMSGIEVLQQLKSNPEFQHIPVVIVSSLESVDEATKCIDAGASDFLSKPVPSAILLEVVTDILGFHPNGEVDPSVVKNVSNIHLDDLPILDPSFITKMLSDYGKTTTTDFITRFQGFALNQKDTILTAARNNDTVQWRGQVNNLKGGARSLGLAKLAGACREIECAFIDDDKETANKATHELETYLPEALKALKEFAVTI
ncbi:MAG: response regulator [Magnetococcales bacterium]|nr:response regulator [Magnetococcales bacterium]